MTPPNPSSSASATASKGPAKKILIVDDEQRLALMFERILRAEGYEVLTATSGEQALALAAEAQPAAILLDVVMPGMDGIATLAELRRRGHTGQVIMMTAQGTFQTAREAMSLGVFEYLTKPFRLDHLKAVLRDSLAYRRTARIGRLCVP